MGCVIDFGANYKELNMRTANTIAKIFAVLLLANVALANEHGGDDARIFSPDQLKWQDGPKSIPAGAKLALLEGDPTKEGTFVMRLRLPDGYTIPLHTHPKMERVTVISGTFNIVMGEKVDKENARKMPAGSFGYWPPGMKHFVWADGKTVVQLHGIGPWSIHYVNPADDPRNKQK
jgi:quercetin dioxygenase-like cupin family protein